MPTNISVDDVIETNNHFKCIDFATADLTEDFILSLQGLLKQGIEFGAYYGKGLYKVMPNTVREIKTTAPEDVAKEMKKLFPSIIP